MINDFCKKCYYKKKNRIHCSSGRDQTANKKSCKRKMIVYSKIPIEWKKNGDILIKKWKLVTNKGNKIITEFYKRRTRTAYEIVERKVK